jgi:hypothetical protein
MATRPSATRRTLAVRVQAQSSTTTPKKVLMMGGTRFIGVYLARQLLKEGHDVTLFTRGKAPITQQLAGESDSDYAAFKSSIKHIQGDRMDFDKVKETLRGSGFQAVYDVNGREGAEVAPLVEALKGESLEQYIYCSSAGVYLKSDQMPHREEDATDVKSRHKVREENREREERREGDLRGAKARRERAERRRSHDDDGKTTTTTKTNRASSTPSPSSPRAASPGPPSAPSTSTAPSTTTPSRNGSSIASPRAALSRSLAAASR